MSTFRPPWLPMHLETVYDAPHCPIRDRICLSIQCHKGGNCEERNKLALVPKDEPLEKGVDGH